MTGTAVRYDIDPDGIVTLTLDDPEQSANTMNERYISAMAAAVDRLYAEQDQVTGVVLASAKKTFFAGGDLKMMIQAGPDDGPRLVAMAEAVKAPLRRLELLPRPVVAAINGAALGGGLEIALAANHRIAVAGRYDIGLPEVTLGLLPGGGGITRTVRMFGLVTAVSEILGTGAKFRPEAARDKGLVDEIVATPEELLPAAKAWIRANPEQHTQPWDTPGYRIPGGAPSSSAIAGILPAMPAMLRKQLRQADVHAPRAILSAAVEGAQVDFTTASTIESRYLATLIAGQQSKNMITAFFVNLGSITSGALRPAGVPPFRPTRVGVLGAGMMGAGIAYSCARAGWQVVLKDTTIEAAERGRAYTAGLNAKAVARGALTQAASDEMLARILPTADPAAFRDVDLVIEAVFEDTALKQQVFREVAGHLAPGALLASNTSTLPITSLAAGVDRPEDFIGLHFFSPVDKMPLVEIIKGERTSPEALARAYDVVLAMKKTPIVVNDSRGFFTSRVIGVQIDEGLAMLLEGQAPMSVERAATQAGFPVGPLQIADELNMELMARIAVTNRTASGGPVTATETVATTMIGAGRPSRRNGAGFYEYPEGRRGTLWAGLADLFPVSGTRYPIEDMRERMLVREAIETARCIEEGVLTSAAHANIGSIFGIGFPAHLGGAAQYVTGYQAADGSTGIGAFLTRADELADRYGEHLRPTPYLRDLATTASAFPA